MEHEIEPDFYIPVTGWDECVAVDPDFDWETGWDDYIAGVFGGYKSEFEKNA